MSSDPDPVCGGRTLQQPVSLDSSIASRVFRMAAPDLFDALVLPQLVARLASTAPGVDVAVVPVAPERLGDALSVGDLDLAVVPAASWAEPLSASPSWSSGPCCTTGFSASCAMGHPAWWEERPALDADLACAHALVSPSGTGVGPVDRWLASRGRHRRFAPTPSTAGFGRRCRRS